MPWELVFLPTECGGLGIKRISKFNVSLLCKWFWRILDNNLWVRLLIEKYGLSKDGFFPKTPSRAIGCNMWLGLSKVYHLFELLSGFKVGRISNLSFWSDCWCPRKGILSVYPSLFELSSNKIGPFSDLYTWESDEQTTWNFFFP